MNIHKSIALGVAVSCLAFSVSGFAQAQVVDSTPSFGSSNSTISSNTVNDGATGTAQTSQSDSTATSLTELFYQMQLLQQEVLSLRGMVEEQSHTIKKLKQQRLDDYLDLDRRVSQLSGGTVTSPTVRTNTSTTSQPKPATASMLTETRSYRSAIDLVLKEKNYNKATEALQQHLQTYPRGSTAANAYYWLGELYLKNNDLTTAKQSFSDLLAQFPDHGKVPDAKYKLAQVLFMQGKKAESKQIMQEVVDANTDASRLAQRFLSKNF